MGRLRGKESITEDERETVIIGGRKCALVKVVHYMTVTQSRTTLYVGKNTVV